MDRLPCLACDRECEAKTMLARAMELSKAGVEVTEINLPCPRDGNVYHITGGK